MADIVARNCRNTGDYRAPLASNQEVSLVGRKLADIYRGPQESGLYMVTALSCPACYSAKDFNEMHDIRVKDVPICTILQNKGCVDGESTGIPTPTYFAVNLDGYITWSFVGAPAPASQSEFLQQLNQMEYSTHDHNQTIVKSSNR